MSIFLSSNAAHSKELNSKDAISDARAQNLTIPQESGVRIPTMNNYGFMFTKFDPIVECFLNSIETTPEQRVFEVGGAYGNVARAGLLKDVAEYWLNDCDERHLKAFARQLEDQNNSELLNSLKLVGGRCPEDVNLKTSYFDGILVNKVVHFFTPETIDNFVIWLKNGLKENGKVYVLTISPFNKNNKELLPQYQKQKEQGERFPGYYPAYSQTAAAKQYQGTTRPQSLLFMELETLEELFVSHGFKIDKTFELGIIDEQDQEWSSGKDLVGIVASKR